MVNILKDVEEIFKNFPKGIECNELKSQRIKGRDEERERILQLVDDWEDKNKKVLRTKQIIKEKIVIADYIKWNKIRELKKLIRTGGTSQ